MITIVASYEPLGRGTGFVDVTIDSPLAQYYFVYVDGEIEDCFDTLGAALAFEPCQGE